jgi:adenosylcobinamide-GDP ribazoletransferase
MKLAAEFRALWSAVMFFTRIPLPSLPNWTPEDLRRASTYFPLVGWLVGGVAAGSWWVASRWWAPGIASGISLATTLLLTGAFHEDGWADVCDGFGGGSTKERVLEIMRDSRVGAFGAIGIMVMLLLKWLAVASLALPLGIGIIICAHAISRGAAISLLATLPYVREEEGKAKPLATRLGGGRLILVFVFSLLPLSLLPLRLWWALAAVAATRLALGRWFVYRIGGYTGDCLGAAQQVTELVFYLTVLALLR